MNFEGPKITTPEPKKTGFKIVKKVEAPAVLKSESKADVPDLGEGASEIKRMTSLSSKDRAPAKSGLAEMAAAANESRLTRAAFEGNPVAGINNLIRNIDRITPDDAAELLSVIPGINDRIFDESFARKSAQLTRMLENRTKTPEAGGLGGRSV